jgi:alpha-glucosidase
MNVIKFSIRALSFVLWMTISVPMQAQQEVSLHSPDAKIAVTVRIGESITYSVMHENTEVVTSLPISMTMLDGKVWGEKAKLKKKTVKSVSQILATPIYKKSEIADVYNELTLAFADNYGLEFRAYNQGVAYRFTTTEKKELKIAGEQAALHFPKDNTVIAAYVRDIHPTIEEQFFHAYQNTYTTESVSRLDSSRLIVLPVLVELPEGKKLCFTEADLEDYPGMYFLKNDHSLESIFPPCPKTTKQGGHTMLQQVVTEREAYMAKSTGARSFPWRVLAVSANDKELLDNDLVYTLASPARIDYSWVKPGKVAWDWWNDWNLYGVDFRAGINNETYKYYIDFASKQGIQYIIIDEGWAGFSQPDLLQTIPEINLQELVDYAKSKNVNIILWMGYWAIDRDMENVCRRYSEMGFKGFKVDFMDRDDQQMVNFYYRCAATAAKYKLMVDFHGAYKPTGLQRTYPNVINFEGVHGLEELKAFQADQVTYDVTMPFIRMLAGPIDYTQGAMRNAIRDNFRPVWNETISQGTRCRQLAEYVIFDSPLNMLCDNPSNYEREQECTSFITQVPTVWDKTLPLDSKIGEYIAIARQKDGVWYIGGLTNWNQRDMTLDLSFLGEGKYQLELFRDGVNADRAARDYKKEIITLNNKSLSVHLMPGGGFAGKISKID